VVIISAIKRPKESARSVTFNPSWGIHSKFNICGLPLDAESSNEITSPAMIRTKKLINFDQFLPSNRKPKGDAIDKTIGIINNRAIDIIEVKVKKRRYKGFIIGGYPDQMDYLLRHNSVSIVKLVNMMLLL
jgi:hypothetical protein